VPSPITSPVAAAIAARSPVRRHAQAISLMALGGLLLVAALARFDAREAAAADQDENFMLEVTWKPPLQAATGESAMTDSGRPVTLWEPSVRRSDEAVVAMEARDLRAMSFADRVVRTGPPTETTNCHGQVFTGGRYWLAPDDVANILADNGYQVVSDPRPGDVVIYANGGTITHTAVVRAAGDGPVLVEGKWGWMGSFLSSPDGSPYGRQFKYYRSPRAGHLLAGLGGPAPATSVAGR